MNAAAIHTTEILVRFANAADGGKKPSVKASDGTYYSVAPADFGRFQPGGRYRIEYVEKEGRGKWKGHTFRDIVKGEPIQQARPAPAHQQRSPGAGDAPQSGEAEFVTRCLAASIMSGTIGRTQQELVERIRILRAAYRDGMS